jgi:predicted Zn-dependent protease
VKALSCSRYWAAKRSTEPTGAHRRFALAGGTAAGVDELVAGVKRGVLITRVWYTGLLDPQTLLTTGLTRDGVFLIEDGRVTAPVNNFRFNESPVTMLKNVEAMTRETFRSPASRVRAPAIRTADFNLASVSEAV